MSGRKALIVVGTRPEAIKLAPVVRALEGGPLVPVVVSTGQHREMLQQALDAFGLRPHVRLDVMQPRQTLHDVTARTLQGMRAVIGEHRPAWVVVQGDTATAFAAALAAFYDKVPVAHVEAGLRSGDVYAPFPEEMNRRLIDQLSAALFCPTASARELLLGDGFAASAIHVTGNTVVDALLLAREELRRRPIDTEQLLGPAAMGRRVLLVTAHRRESFGGGMEAICRALARIADAAPDVCVVYPVHLNPNVDGPVRRILGDRGRVVLLPPVAYLEFVALMERAHLVLTDSGGVQEEAPTFSKPLLVARDVTERPEGIAAGVAKLVGTSEERIFDEAMRLLRDPRRYAAMATGVNPYGDGNAAGRIARVLVGRHTPARERTVQNTNGSSRQRVAAL